MTKIALALVLTTIIATAGVYYTMHSKKSTAESLWEDFKLKYNVNYLGQEEHDHRFGIFKANLERIAEYQAKDTGAQYGVTKFADLTRDEFRTKVLGLHPKQRNLVGDDDRHTYKPTNTTIPASFDWRTLGAVTPVKNQGQCGSCWAFSAIQNLEGQNAIKHKKLQILSEQELVDCDTTDDGCDGGLMENAMTFLSTAGVVLESDYPYTGEDGQCSLNSSESVLSVTGYLNISTDETVIAQSLVELGPLSIAVHADPWQFYYGGISNPWGCGGDLDHGVLLVGYGSGPYYHFWNRDFWIIKNSWGADWGESGYIRIVRGSGVCGMNQDIITGTIA